MGVGSWRHPRIEMEMFDDSPGAELLAIIDAAQWKVVDSTVIEAKEWKDVDGVWCSLFQLRSASSMSEVWENGSLDLEVLLLKSTMHKESERLLRHHKIDRLLSRLKEDQPDRIIHRRTPERRTWLISK